MRKNLFKRQILKYNRDKIRYIVLYIVKENNYSFVYIEDYSADIKYYFCIVMDLKKKNYTIL